MKFMVLHFIMDFSNNFSLCIFYIWVSLQLMLVKSASLVSVYSDKRLPQLTLELTDSL